MSRLLFELNGGQTITTPFSDSVTPSDATPAFTATKALSDSITPSDAQTFTATKGLSDSVTPSDSTAFTATKGLTDSVTPSDATPVFTATKGLTDSVTPSDAMTFDVTKVLADAVTVTDDIAFNTETAGLSDDVTPTDTVDFDVTKELSDSVTPSDTVAFEITKVLSDSVTVADSAPSVALIESAFLADSVSVTDVISLAVINGMFPWSRSLGTNQGRIAPLTRKAVGSIRIVDGPHLLDGDFFVLRDGVNTVTFEYDSDGLVGGGNVPIVFDPFDTEAQVKAETIATILSVGDGLLISAGSNPGTEIVLENDVAGELGNQPITNGVADVGFSVTDFVGGALAGRVAGIPSAPEGLFVFCLGYQLPGLEHRFDVGDYSEVSQVADFGANKVIHVKAIVRPSLTMPGGIGWRLSLRIDGVVFVDRILTPGRARRFVDLAANVATLVGDHELAVRVELVSL